MIRMEIEEHVTLSTMLGVKQKRPGFKKPILEMKVGDSMSVDGTIAQVDQVIDRTVDPAQYRKRVVKADGTVVRDISEPLSAHVGRGSAKPKPKS